VRGFFFALSTVYKGSKVGDLNGGSEVEAEHARARVTVGQALRPGFNHAPIYAVHLYTFNAHLPIYHLQIASNVAGTCSYTLLKFALPHIHLAGGDDA